MRDTGVAMFIWDFYKLVLWFITLTYWRRETILQRWNYSRIPQYLYPLHYLSLSASTAEISLFILEANDFKDIFATAVFWINSFMLPPFLLLSKWLFFSHLSFLQVYWMHGFIVWIKFFLWFNQLIAKTKDGSEKAKCIFRISLGISIMACGFAGAMYVMQGVHPDAEDGGFGYIIGQYASFFYLAIITFSTVGYGDMAPSTIQAKISAICFIFWMLMWVPMTINRTIQLVTGKNRLIGHLSSWAGIKRFILIIGDVDPFQLSQFISRIYYSSQKLLVSHKSICSSRRIVVLTPNDIDIYNNQVTQAYTLGVPLCIMRGDIDLGSDLGTLETIRAQYASSIFVLSSFKGSDLRKRDVKTAVRAIGVKKYGCNSENIMIQYCSSIGHNIFSRPFGSAVSLHELKISIITKNIICPGIITLIINLTLSYNNIGQSLSSKRDPSGIYQSYLNGVEKVICVHKIPENFKGVTFESLCNTFYKLNGLIMIGVIDADEPDSYKINPSGTEYYIKDGDSGIFILDSTNSPSFSQEAETNESVVINRNSLLSNFIKSGILKIKGQNLSDFADYETTNEDYEAPKEILKMDSLVPSENTTQHTKKLERGVMVVNSITTACKYVFKNRSLPIIAIIGFSDFVSQLLMYFETVELFNIVIMGHKISTMLNLGYLERFKDFLAVIDVDLMKQSDVIAAEFHKANYFYITPNLVESSSDFDRDLTTIVIYRQIKSILVCTMFYFTVNLQKSLQSMDAESVTSMFNLVELENLFNVTYLDDSKWTQLNILKERVDSSLVYINSREYATGQLISDEMLYNVIMTSFSTIDNFTLYNILLDMVSVPGSKRKCNGVELINIGELNISGVRRTFGVVFQHLLSERNAIMIGIYRIEMNPMDNFVICAPGPNFLVHNSDMVGLKIPFDNIQAYIISKSDQLFC
ncbi:hypothetical protein BEWA_008960 [Theileria equi strain WA]|uniref:Uncharacterized protein n=1 Tax=Theileria equi strain WA TaxID=1537102 RepID=L0B305_THEEQ|nr:hypothetical protein BEWA_008960 [Theileria equi strain WA]AFZ81484.1 hypothetical protein BEWA_008960 [Theileria equi strain WA]|eukprot:XP_004831150.1 hypothetical protein BEWA_008960 [Theileria equi strain WA]